MAKCLVLGADGFIGYHLTMGLLAAGHEVRAFDRMRNGRPFNLPEEQPRMELFPGDFLNTNDLNQALEGMEYVFHLVSTTNPAVSAKDPLLDIRTNLRMSVELMQLCVQHHVKRFIFPSTGGAIYGQNVDHSLKETELTEPVSPYAIGKLAIEGYLRFFKHAHNLDYLAFRISNPFGVRQNVVGSQGVIPIFMNLLNRNQPLTVFGDGSMVRDYIYVTDNTDGLIRAFDQPAQHSIYNLGSGAGLSVARLVTLLEEVTGKKAQVNHLPSRPADIHRVVLDVSRFEKEFGTLAKTPMEKALAATWEFVRQKEDEKSL